MTERVEQFYDQQSDSEWQRLTQGLSAVEYATTMALIGKHFPPKGRVLDIGSGPGRYAIELTRNGYDVTLLDLSQVLLQRAAREYRAQGLPHGQRIQGTATDLTQFADGSFDAALMLGPLIHLADKTDRLNALSEMKRVLTPTGVAIVQYLNSWGLIRTGLTDFPDWFDEPKRIFAMLQPQDYQNDRKGFTLWYWSTPPDALAEIETSGLALRTYAGAESFLGGMPDVLARVRSTDVVRYANVVSLAVSMSELPQFRDATDHLVVVTEKRG